MKTVLPDGQSDVPTRAGAYADGLFETIAFRRGKSAFWPWHMQRLLQDAPRLALQPPDSEYLYQQAYALAAGRDCVIRITLARAHGQGYFPELDCALNGRQVSSGVVNFQRRDWPPDAAAALRLDWADMQLSSQPLLAGIKHLARLEQVLAATEARLRGLDELLLCDADGYLVEAISNNVLIHTQDGWLTPQLQQCGVAGVMRNWLLQQGLIKVARLHRSDLRKPLAIALCNAVRGVQSVAMLGDLQLDDNRAVKPLQAALASFIDAQANTGQAECK